MLLAERIAFLLDHDTLTPDIETATEAYAQRFAGPAGRYFLEVQQESLTGLLGASSGGSLRVLELGGGHGQLAPALLAAGHEVWVQGSAARCATRLRPLLAERPDRLRFVVSSLWALPFADRTFDVVLAVRLLAHVERWPELLQEMARLSRRTVIVDFPARFSANLLEPVLFALKRRLEGNTRPFFCYHAHELHAPLAGAGFGRFRVARQFVLPMVLHRKLQAPGLSATLEGGCRRLGLTALLGTPCLLAAERVDAPVAAGTAA